MRRSLALVSLAALGGGGALGRRALQRKIASWSTNPDPTDGDPLGLPDGEDLFLEADDGARLHGFRCGDPAGDTVLLVHGYVESVGFWGPVARRLAADGHDVVLLDQRGHGRSARGEAPYSTSTLGDDVRQWIEYLDLRDATLVGHSMGGVASMAFAADHLDLAGERLVSLVLVTTQAVPLVKTRQGGDPVRAMAVVDRIFRLEDLGLFPLLRVFGTRPARVALEALRAGLLGTDVTTRIDGAAMFADIDLRPGLPDIGVPTLVIAGSHDGLTPVAANELIAELIPNATIEVVPGRGHMLAFEAPDVLTDFIVQARKPTDESR